MRSGKWLWSEIPHRRLELQKRALAVEPEGLEAMLRKAKAEGRQVRGPVDHGFIRSIYFRDPNGYVIEFPGRDLQSHNGPF